MRKQGLRRWGPLAGPVFVVLMVAGFLISGNSPDTDASNVKIARYLHDTSNFNTNVVSFFILLAALLSLVAFFGALRSRVVEAEGGNGGAAALGYGAGIASAVLLFVAICLFISPLIAAHDAPRRVLEPGVYRFAQDMGYIVWVGSVVVGALAVWSTSAVALRTGLLPRWFAIAGYVVGVICLAAILFFPIFLYWLWILVAGGLLVRSSAAPAAAVAPGGGG